MVGSLYVSIVAGGKVSRLEVTFWLIEEFEKVVLATELAYTSKGVGTEDETFTSAVGIIPLP